MTRTRSEYRLGPIPQLPAPAVADVRHVVAGDRDALAVLFLDAYRGTVDDEGEDLDDAYDAIDEYLPRICWEHSFVVTDDEANHLLVACSFALVVDGLHYVDPVVVAPSRKRAGVGSVVVRLVLRSLAEAGVDEVGATITDGNVPSERLFAGLGFVRRGPWPP